MGRLLKREADTIKQMQKHGYTHKEIAEATGRSIRTVSKYSKEAPIGTRPGFSERISTLEEQLRSVGELALLLLFSLDDDDLFCPRCEDFSLRLAQGPGWIYVCKECGYKLGPIPMQAN